MKLNVKYMIAAFALLGLVGCDKNFEEFGRKSCCR